MTLRPGAYVPVLAVVVLLGGSMAGGYMWLTPEAARAPTGPAPDPPVLALAKRVEGYSNTVWATYSPDDPTGLFVLEQGGRVLHFANGTGTPTVALDLTGRVAESYEQGLLGLAFRDGGDGSRPVAFVSYTALDNTSVLARYRFANATGPILDPASVEVLMEVPQPAANHNGGHVTIGPDGHLYYALGDGGSYPDAQRRSAQDTHSPYGAILRLDVTPPRGYAIPPDNPFADGKDGAPEVWIKGLRNPWRLTFDAVTGDAFIADVGEAVEEEVNHVPNGTGAGANFGWPIFEGTRWHPITAFPGGRIREPAIVYDHAGGDCAVVGGEVYRGSRMPDLAGAFVFADFCTGRVWGARESDGEWRVAVLAVTNRPTAALVADAAGELLVVDRAGLVWDVVPGGGDVPDAIRAPR